MRMRPESRTYLQYLYNPCLLYVQYFVRHEHIERRMQPYPAVILVLLGPTTYLQYRVYIDSLPPPPLSLSLLSSLSRLFSTPAS